MKKITYLSAAMLAFMFASMMAMAQTIWPVVDDVTIGMYNGMGITTRYVATDKTGRLQFIMYGQDPSPGAPVGQLRPQRRVFGPSIVCGNTFDGTCDVVASAVNVTSSQINDATATGRALLTAADANTARSAIGAPSASDLTAGLAGKAATAHTHVATDITDSTATGRALLGASTAAAARSTLGLGTVALSNVPASGNAAGAEVVLATDTRLTDARTPLAHTHTAAQISDATGAGRSILTAADASAIRALLSVPSSSDVTAGARSAISVTGAATYNSTTGVINVPVVTVPTINRTRVTTAADGSYTWALPVACTAGTTPIVSITPESATANDAISHRVVSTTNSSVTIFAGRSAALTVLNLTVLGVPAGAAVPVHLIAICP